MRVISLAKVVGLTAAIALSTSFSGTAFAAPKMKLPPGACAFEKKSVASNTVCSFDCNAANNWCSQQWCHDGQWTQVINCFGAFCSPKCGG